MIEVRFHFGHLDRLPRCDHTKLATIFCSCPLCECILNSTQGMGQRDDRAASKPAVSITFHDNLNAEGRQHNHAR
jgi:hypothetical protein